MLEARALNCYATMLRPGGLEGMLLCFGGGAFGENLVYSRLSPEIGLRAVPTPSRGPIFE
jgi:hypothetical protein